MATKARRKGGKGWDLSYRQSDGDVVTTSPDSWEFLEAAVLIAKWEARPAESFGGAAPARTLYVGPSALVTLDERAWQPALESPESAKSESEQMLDREQESLERPWRDETED